MESTRQSSAVETQFLVISDTHGMELRSHDMPLHHVDVALHCGDLTQESTLDEYLVSLRLLQDIQAPLKLVIAGNHDFTLDIPAFRRKITDANPPLDSDLVTKTYGEYGEAKRIFEEAQAAGIAFLDEGTHNFVLDNGAVMTVFASPRTPALGEWGFQYSPREGHRFAISNGVDLVITHGPPKGIMDMTDARERAGCPDLFGAIARARPRMHCFGHIHEGWGARLVTWRDQISAIPSHLADIDNGKSVLIDKLSGLYETRYDEAALKEEKLEKAELLRQQRCYPTSHCTGDPHPIEYGAQTLFVNAAIQGTGEHPLQLPWLVRLELPRAA